MGKEGTLYLGNNWIITGRGEWVRWVRKKPAKNEKGHAIWKFLLKPSKKIVEEYGIEDDLDPESEMIIMEYEDDCVTPLKETPQGSIIFIETDLLGGEETPAARKNMDLKIKIREYQTENKTLRSALARKNEQLHKTLVAEDVVAKDTVNRVLSYRKAAGKTSKEEFDDTAELDTEEIEGG